MVAAQPRLGGLLAALGLVDRAVPFDALRLDALFVPGGTAVPLVREAGAVVSWFGARDADFTARLLALAPAVVVAPTTSPGRVVWRHLLETIGARAEESPALRASVRVAERLREAGRAALANAGWSGGAPVALVHPGAGGIAKRWPVDGFATVVQRLAARGLAVVLHEGPADAEAVGALAGRVAAPLVLRDPSLPALAGVLAAARCYVGNDSGVSQLAAAVGVPSVVLYRASLVEWEPWAEGVTPLVVSTDALVRSDVDAVLGQIDALVA